MTTPATRTCQPPPFHDRLSSLGRLAAGPVVALVLCTGQAWAQSAAPAAAVAASAAAAKGSAPAAKPTAGASAKRGGSSTPAKPSTKPAWSELTPDQQKALAPLAASWASLSDPQRRKWLAFTGNYPKLTPEEQQKLHSRMTEWAALSPLQRDEARMNFAEVKKLSPSEKAANWQAYQALSPEEKQQLAAKAEHKLPGATATVKPVPEQKLAAVPITRQASKPLAPASHVVAHRPASAVASAPAAVPAAAKP